MYNFRINGVARSFNEDISLLKYLREELHITSAKDGCSKGACGTCTVLVNGKATKACIVKLSRLENKEVITVEGLSEYEKDVYVYAFSETGAVQCGFCIPGFIISAKALLDTNNNPSYDEVNKAIRGNICRCTGYVKIVEAILLASKIFREKQEVPKRTFIPKIGEDVYKVDAYEKILGTGKYADDLYFENMLYGKAVRSKYPRAKVLSINIEEAKKHKDCVNIFTADDIKGHNKIGHIVKDWDTLIKVGGTTRYLGDSILLVASTKEESLKEIIDLINIEYEELTPVTKATDALKEDAPLVHEKGNLLVREHLNRGDVDTAIKNSKYVVTKKYKTPPTEHAFMEPECAVATYKDGEIVVYTGGQSVYDEKKEIAEVLGIDEQKVSVISMNVGGGFGGKEDMSVQHHASLISYLTKQPVKVKLTREESIIVHPKRHGMEMEFTTACDENGKLTALKAYILADTGAYASLGGPVLQRACTHAGGPYSYKNLSIVGEAVYTNNPPCGAFRGFGVTQSNFALECNLNLLAEMVGISEFDIRYINAIKIGEKLPNGQIADENTALVETLDSVKDIYNSHKNVGIACAFKNAGIGVGLEDTGRCIVSIENGKIYVRTSAADIGQGIMTIVMQIAGEVLNMSSEHIIVEKPSTTRTPRTGTTTASRQTAITGEATKRACLKLKEALQNNSLKQLEGKEFLGEYSPRTDEMGSTKENPISHISYGYATQVAILKDSGEVEKIVASHDSGTIIYPKGATGQIEGGVVMGMGYALTEDYPLVNCVPQVTYAKLGLLRANQIPKIESILVSRKNIKNKESFGAKGIGEITTVPTAAAIQNAYYKLDKNFRTSLPLENTFYKK